MDEELPPAANAFSNMNVHRLAETDEENSSDEYESLQGAHGFHPSNPPPGQTQINPQATSSNLVQNPKDLAIFGKFDAVAQSDAIFQIIEKYVHNSHGLPGGGDVKVHNIYELSGSGTKGAWKSLVNKMKPSQNTHGTGKMLLWYKTTPAGIKKLAQGQDGCVAFYDRICRAFTEKPANLQAPPKQFFLLCVVSLGKLCKDPNGYQKWSQTGQAPAGYDTVKGMGYLCPDGNETYCDNSVTIPCGPTIKHGQYRKYELEYNEYIIFESMRIQVNFAVECEIIPTHLIPNSGLGKNPVSANSDSEDEILAAIAASSNHPHSVNQPILQNVGQPVQPQTNLSAPSQNIQPRPAPRFPQHGGRNTTAAPNNLNRATGSQTPRGSTNNVNRPPYASRAPQARQNAVPGPSTTQPSLASILNRSLNLGSGSGPTILPPVPTQHQPQPPTQSKKNKIEQAALQELMKLSGASASAFKKCLYKAQIITPADEIHDHIHTYVKNGSVHGYGMRIQNIIRIVRDNDLEFQHDPKLKGKQRMMLWHGTKENVVAGILQTGFKIPAAKNQMFGMGIYFADRASKSANYCGSTRKGGIAYLFLCDVAIGTHYNSKNAKNNYTAPPTITTKTGTIKHFDSLKCTGAKIPDESENVDFYGSTIPLGKTIPNTKYPNCTVQYNEFIVYNSSQVKIKYLVKVQFT